LKEKINIVKFYFSYVGFGMVLLVSFSFITGMLESVGISLVLPIIQNLLLGENSIGNLKISFIDDITKVIGIETSNKNLIILLFGTFILKAVFKFTTGYIKVFYSSRFLLQLRNNLLNLFTNLDYLGYTKRDAGKLSNSFTLEVENLISGFIYFSNYLVTIFTGFSFIFFILTINAWFALIILLFGAIYYSLFKRINVSIKDISTSITENNSGFNSLLIQYIHSFKYLKSTNSFDKLKQQLIETVKRIRNLKIKKDIKANFISSIQEPALLLIIALVIFLSLNIIKIPAASVFILLMLFYRSTNYFLTSQNTWNTFLGQTGSTSSIMSLQASLIESKEVIEGTKDNKLAQSIDLKDISFYYNQDKTVLKNITISIPAYKTIAFVGKSGSGKSTLINIITGLIIPKDGRVLLDKIPLNTINLHSWRNQIGYITQESVIFNDTILNNITMWDYHEEKDSERLKNAIEMSHLSDFIQNQNDLSKLVGDRGITISGGQRQRICIARELYKSPSLLILDEATSALDSETEKYVQESIDALKGKITLILIAHRFSTIKNADIIHVMEAGKVVESGTFSELVENGSGFKKIYELQNL
jgi:ABC-type multidrug transport system fused ATPase/permease subunit